MRSKEEKRTATMDKFGIDFDSYDMNELRRRNIDAAQNIAASLSGSKMYSAGSLLSGKPEITFLMELSRAQIEQNFILIRQNEEILRWLKGIYGQNIPREY